MCYSVQIRASYKRCVREWAADISIKQFVHPYCPRCLPPRKLSRSAVDGVPAWTDDRIGRELATRQGPTLGGT